MRRTLPVALILLLAAGACGPAEVVVTMEIDVTGADGSSITQPLTDVEVQLIPFDRDVVFDSLTQVYPEPEPPIPPELVEQRAAVRSANEEWQNNTNRWQTIRDTLQTLTTALEQYNRGESRYQILFLEWQDWDGQLSDAEDAMEASFGVFDELQRGTIRASDSIGLLQEAWADEAFRDVGLVFDAKSDASGLDWAVDTTDASGVARGNLRVAPGQYWVYARYQIDAYTELYWNEVITVEKTGEPHVVELRRADAEERPIL